MSYEKPRLTLTETAMSAITKMAGGNPGAVTVLVEIMKEGQTNRPTRSVGRYGLDIALGYIRHLRRADLDAL